MVPFYQAILPAMGFNRHLPLEARYGPKKYNGKGLVHLYTHQFLKHLEWFVGTLRRNDRVGKIMRIQVAKYQMFLGTEHHFLTLNSNDFAYGENCRMKFLWDEISKRGITIHLADGWTERPKRDKDVWLMDAIRHTTSSSTCLTRINDVRLYKR